MNEEDHWPYGFPLADPVIREGGRRACNEPYVVRGQVMGYCSVLVKSDDKPHRGKHRLEWE